LFYSTNILFLTGDEENVEKFNRRLVKVSKQHNEECKELLKLMGVPFIEVTYLVIKNLKRRGLISMGN